MPKKIELIINILDESPIFDGLCYGDFIIKYDDRIISSEPYGVNMILLTLDLWSTGLIALATNSTKKFEVIGIDTSFRMKVELSKENKLNIYSYNNLLNIPFNDAFKETLKVCKNIYDKYDMGNLIKIIDPKETDYDVLSDFTDSVYNLMNIKLLI